MHWRLVSVSGLVGAIALAPCSARAQDRPAPAGKTTLLLGRVADRTTLEPLAGAILVVTDIGRSARSMEGGAVRLANISQGMHNVRVRVFGYHESESQIWFNADTLNTVFLLDRASRVLDTVVVSTDVVAPGLRDFDARRRMGIGRFMTALDLEKEGTRNFGQMLSLRMPGFRMVHSPDGRAYLGGTRGNCSAADRLNTTAIQAALTRQMLDERNQTDKTRVTGKGNATDAPHTGIETNVTATCGTADLCAVHVYLDDQYLASEDIDIIHTTEIAAVEVYSGSSMPAKYRIAGSACGVVLAWSRWR